jgi:nucleotide-binding universal stress UspA family protein
MAHSTAVGPDTPKAAPNGTDAASRAIVVGYDGSDQAKAALEVAIGLARCGAFGQIVIACGQERPAGWFGYTYRGPAVGQEQFWEDLETQIVKDLEEAAATVRAAGINAATVCTREHPVDTLLTVARETGAGLIVVGAKGTSAMRDAVMGSTTMRLLHHAKIPVLVVPEAV